MIYSIKNLLFSQVFKGRKLLAAKIYKVSHISILLFEIAKYI